MPKPSKTVIYTLVGSVAAYAVVLLTQPDATVKKRKAPTSATKLADANGITEADIKAHFARYTGGARDPFAPGVVPPKPQATASKPLVRKLAGPDVGGPHSGWALTGIDDINGSASALVENSATGESVDLKPGDQWNGLRVVSINPDAVVLENALGQQTRLGFIVTDTQGAGNAKGTMPAPLTGAAPAAPTDTTLPAPTADNTAPAGRRGGRGRNRGGGSSSTSGNPLTESSNP